MSNGDQVPAAVLDRETEHSCGSRRRRLPLGFAHPTDALVLYCSRRAASDCRTTPDAAPALHLLPQGLARGGLEWCAHRRQAALAALRRDRITHTERTIVSLASPSFSLLPWSKAVPIFAMKNVLRHPSSPHG